MKTIGTILIVAGVGSAVLGILYFLIGLITGSLTAAGALLGLFILLLVVVAPMVGGGFILLTRNKSEEASEADSDALRTILDMVKARGEVTMSDVIIELGSNQKDVQEKVYQLVGMGLFDGYINWDQGTLYSSQASQLYNLSNCRNCGGEIKIAGKGVFQCPFCGTEYYLSEDPDAA